MYLKRNIFLKNNISMILMRYKTINKNLIIKEEYTIEIIKKKNHILLELNH